MYGSEEQQAMLNLANRMWDGFFAGKVVELLKTLNVNVQSYIANVVTAYDSGTGRVVVQRPFDTTNISVPCVASMQGVSVGDKVLVVTFGFGGNASNSVVFCKADYSNL